MDLAAAQEAAERFVLDLQRQTGVELLIVGDSTIEFDSGWVFFYDSRKYLESGSISDALAGNAPLIVSRHDGSVHVTGTAYPIERYIREFQESRST